MLFLSPQDRCGGYTNGAGQYRYYTSSNFPYVPICYYATEGLGQTCGFTP